MILVYKIFHEAVSERILKVGPDLPKLWSKVECMFF